MLLSGQYWADQHSSNARNLPSAEGRYGRPLLLCHPNNSELKNSSHFLLLVGMDQFSDYCGIPLTKFVQEIFEFGDKNYVGTVVTAAKLADFPMRRTRRNLNFVADIQYGRVFMDNLGETNCQ